MNFTKDELNFLDLFALCTENKKDNRATIYGKIVLKTNKEKGVVSFTQYASDTNLYKEVKKEVVEDFELVMPTIQVYNLIKLLPKDCTISITKDGITFNKNKYSFEKEDVVFPSLIKFVEKYNESEEILVIKDLSNLNAVKSYIGSYENNLDTVNLNQKHFISKSNDVIASAKTTNDESVFYFMSKVILNVVNAFKLKDIEFKKFTDDEVNYSACRIADTYIFIVDKEYVVPDIFLKEYKDLYGHTTKVIVEKSVLLESLSRIKLFTNPTLEHRIYFTVTNENSVNIKTDTNSSVVETINAVADSELVGKTIVLSSISLFQVSTEFEGKLINIFIDSVGSAPTCRVEDEESKAFYILRLFDDEVEEENYNADGE